MKTPTLIFTLLLFFFSIYPSTPQPRRETLDNGLRVLLIPKPGTSLINMVVGIRLGSKDETAETNGWVHLLEHILFVAKSQSTQGSSAGDTDGCRERGCFFNAHTDHDLITVELSLPEEEASYGLRFLKEKVFTPRFDENSLATEQVILAEELDQIHDDPARLGMSLVLSRMFAGHPYENPVYGRSENIVKAELSDIQALHGRRFHPGNSVLTVVGEFQSEILLPRIREIFGELKSKPAFSETDPPPPLKKTGEETITMDIQQAHLMIGFPVPGFNHPDREKVAVLNHLLGHGNHPLLSRYMVGKRPLAEGFACQYIALRHGGALILHLRAKPKKVGTLKREVIKFLGRLRTFRYSAEDFLEKDRPFITDFLQAALNHIRLNSALFQERGLNLARLSARSILLGDTQSNGDHDGNVSDITSKDLRAVASKYICGKRHITLMILPIQEK